MPPFKVSRLARLKLNVADLDRACAFYVEALGFTPRDCRVSGEARLMLGAQELILQAAPQAAPYPTPRAANDPWFQHFAIAVADMDAAYARLRPHVGEPISLDGPERLPPSTGSVTAYKFRDPDGHPLELSFAPESDWAKAATSGGALFQGIDHTALAVADLDASIAFYTALGFKPGPRLLNEGPEQDRLDGLTGVKLDIAVLFTPQPGPHLELLHYRQPLTPAATVTMPQGVAASCTVLIGSGPVEDRIMHDPDGHKLQIAADPA